MERIKHPVKLVDCGKENIKITTPDDIDMAEFILSKREVKK
jgi:2-C-methyl-D-erythritol 4-phosphate cytidylyltransferase